MMGNDSPPPPTQDVRAFRITQAGFPLFQGKLIQDLLDLSRSVSMNFTTQSHNPPYIHLREVAKCHTSHTKVNYVVDVFRNVIGLAPKIPHKGADGRVGNF